MAILVRSKTAAEDKNKWATQWSCFLDGQHHFKRLTGKDLVLDVAAEPQTAKLSRFYVSPNWINEQNGDYSALQPSHQLMQVIEPKIVGFDALQCNWEDGWWCNPPFDLKPAFIKKAVEEMFKGYDGMMLLPYEPLTGWWLDLVEPYAKMVFEPDGRYSFYESNGYVKKHGVNFGSALILFSRKNIVLPRERIIRSRLTDDEVVERLMKVKADVI